MKKRKLGANSSLEITPLIYGSWGISGPPFWTERNDAVSIKTIQTALDCGINTIDTAPVYGYGRSEELIAKAIAGRKEKVIIATKCGLRWNGSEVADIQKDLSADFINQEVENSLRRLNVDKIDLYQIHWPDPNTPLEITMSALVRLKEQGKIREIGVSNFDENLLAEAEKYGPIVSLQPKYNVLEREIENAIIPHCTKKGIGIIAYSPLASGMLSGKYTKDSKFDDWRGKKMFGVFTDENWEPAMAKVVKLQDVAEDFGFTMPQLALRWVVEQKGVTAAIIGANSPNQIRENTLAMELRITDEVMDAIRMAVE